MRVRKIENLEKFESLFHQLEPESDISCFQSWGWVESSLNLFDEERVLLVAMLGDEVVGIAPFFINPVKRNKFISSRILFLNEVENSRYYMFVEYNGFIAKRGLESEIADVFLDYLMSSEISFDEIIINRVLSDNPIFSSKVIRNRNLNVSVTDEGASRYVDLKKLRDHQQDYISTLSKNSRAQLRRTFRKYKELGEITLDCASCADEALQYFRELGALHQKYWIAKGLPGAFSKKGWVEFHETMINQRFEFSEVQLLKISVGCDVMGYVYSLVRNRHVYMIQTGFNYLPDKAFRAGFVCHFMSIEYNKSQGMDVYNFLVGDHQYKRSLSNGFDTLSSIVIQKRKLKFKLEKTFLNFKKLISGYFQNL